MVRPGLRSSGFKKVSKRVPGGRSRTFYVRRKHYRVRDPITGNLLSGVPSNPEIIRGGPKTRKRPERYYGGMLSPSTLVGALKIAIRNMG